MTGPTTDVQQRLSHILWIGGAPDAGKTSIATAIAQKHGLQLYVFDRHEPAHIARRTPDRQPALDAFMAMSMDERWVLPAPEAMAEDTIASWTERFAMVIEDVLALPVAPPILAEGPGLFPECVAPFLSDQRQAIWLLPTEAFKLRAATWRDKPGSRHGTSEPERARRNWLQRDLLLAAHVRRRAGELGLTIVDVDGTQPLAEMVATVEAHFGRFLPRSSPT